MSNISKPRSKVIESSFMKEDELYDAFNRVYSAGSKIGVFYHKDFGATLKQFKKTAPPKLLTTRYMLENRALQLPHANFFFNVLDRKIQQYIEADLINYNMRHFHEINDAKKEDIAVRCLDS